MLRRYFPFHCSGNTLRIQRTFAPGVLPMTLTKNHIISALHNQLELPKTRSTELVESLLEIIKKSLENSEDVLISGFGKFSVKTKNERRGRNPQTGQDLVLGSRRVVTFRCSPVLRERINKEE